MASSLLGIWTLICETHSQVTIKRTAIGPYRTMNTTAENTDNKGKTKRKKYSLYAVRQAMLLFPFIKPYAGMIVLLFVSTLFLGASEGGRAVLIEPLLNKVFLAKNNAKLTPQDFGELRRYVIERAKEPGDIRAEIKRRVAENDPRDAAQVKSEHRQGVLRRLASFLGSARKELGAERLVPAYLLKQMDDLREKLEHQLL